MTEQDSTTPSESRWRRYLGRVASRVVAWAETGPDVDAAPQLMTLRPKFMPDQHQQYVDHLTQAVHEDGVCNIALTGRYGAGKSSVLTEFAEQHKGRVLFLSLSTLGPETKGESRTQQIQKELVKQLLHREKPSRLPQSRYQRIDRLPRTRAAIQATAVLGSVAVLLWLLGAAPELPGLESDLPATVRAAAIAIVACSSIAFLTWLRLSVHNRLEVSGVSAAGASVTLAKKSESYFDQYLDEIVYFFEAKRNIDIVVFEDLDRFNDAGIFENLRELNTLLNSSKQSTSARYGRRRRTIRFVYALRDSIFQELGHDTAEIARTDLAAAETSRANRTKFFDFVIPMVPFITHRTARELMAGLLEGPTVPPVRDDLVDLVARHVPDMRLLINIRNEYAVFANRLITGRKGMDSLTGDDLFAMVAYKNVHLGDFELMLLGRSQLDFVYRQSRQLVSDTLAERRTRLRQLRNARAFRNLVEQRAEAWGKRLDWLFRDMVAGLPQTAFQYYAIEQQQLSEEPTAVAFWQRIIQTGKGVDAYVSNPYGGKWLHLSMADLERHLGAKLSPEALSEDLKSGLAAEEQQIREDLVLLKTADFPELVERPDFTLKAGEESASRPFTAILGEHIKSELGQALIAQGYISRYYTLVVAQYYGERVPPNAMNFIIQNVDQNVPDVNYPLSSADVEAILKETKRSFLNDASAYNINLLDHLLSVGDDGAHLVLDRLSRTAGDTSGRDFLEAYLTDGQRTPLAVAYMSSRRPSLLIDLIQTIELPDDRRVELVDAALAHAGTKMKYESNDEVRTFVESRYRDFPTLAAAHPARSLESAAPALTGKTPSRAQIKNSTRAIQGLGGVLEDLRPLTTEAVSAVVEAGCYVISASNLRVALAEPPTLSLDTIRDRDPRVFEHVIGNPEAYLEALANDVKLATEHSGDSPLDSTMAAYSDDDRQATPAREAPRPAHTIQDPRNFRDVVQSLASLPPEIQARIVAAAAEDCVITNLRDVPESTWQALAGTHRFTSALANVGAYMQHAGGIDEGLASLLVNTGVIQNDHTAQTSTDEEETGAGDTSDVTVAIAVLNAASQIPDARVRVNLVESLEVENYLDVDHIRTERGDLLGHLLRANICADTAKTFARFDTDHWPTVSFGIKNSKNFIGFAAEILTADTVGNLLDDPSIPAAMKKQVLKKFEDYTSAGAPEDTLRAAAKAALVLDHRLGLPQIQTIVDGTEDGGLAVRLLHARRDVTAAQALGVLSRAAHPYDQLGSSGAALTFPSDTEHRWLFGQLQRDSRLTFKTYQQGKRRPARIEVVVP